MRELKFRAYLTEKKRMFIPDYEFVKDKTLLGFFRRLSHFNEPHIIMQYTGGKDRTGNDIYEGDILEKNSFKWEVKFKKGSFIGVCNDDGFERTAQLYDNNTKKETIIGNVYENPELIWGDNKCEY